MFLVFLHFNAVEAVERIFFTNTSVVRKKIKNKKVKNWVFPVVSLSICSDLYICADLVFPGQTCCHT